MINFNDISRKRNLLHLLPILLYLINIITLLLKDQETIRFCLYHWFQIRKETEKAFVPKVVISTTKAKEQETRITGEITTKEEQKQITQEKVSPIL